MLLAMASKSPSTAHWQATSYGQWKLQVQRSAGKARGFYKSDHSGHYMSFLLLANTLRQSTDWPDVFIGRTINFNVFCTRKQYDGDRKRCAVELFATIWPNLRH